MPCVYYIHGGGMQAMSCFYGIYRAWGKFIAREGVAVASSYAEVIHALADAKRGG